MLRHDGIILNGVGFNMASKYSILKQEKPLDIIFTIDQNEWNGNKNLQLKLLDLRLAEGNE